MPKEKLTYEELHKNLDYDPDTGLFTRLIANSPTVTIGDIAGTRNQNGYIEIKINSVSYKAHRLAWLWVEGYFPEVDIDHEDQIRHNNRWDNLRLVSQQCNSRNCGNPKNNISGVKGISWYKPTNRWLSGITVNYKREYLGRYKSFDDAVCARLAGEQCLGWEGCDSNSPAFRYVQKMLNRKIKL